VREDALIAEVRYAAQLPDLTTDYPDSRLRTELNNVLQEKFAPILVAARVGMLLKRASMAVSAAAGSTYALPSRAMAAGFEALDITDGTTYWPLTEIMPHQAWEYESTSTGRPRFYVVVGSSLRVYPSPNTSYTLRCQYYLRPSRIVERQTFASTGRITAVDASQSLIEFSGLGQIDFITDRDTATSISPTWPVDIIRGSPSGAGSVQSYDASYEVVAVSLPNWIDVGGAGSSMSFEAGTDLSEVRAGDYVRAYNQSEWPTMPHEYHVLLTKSAAARICRDRGMYSAAAELETVAESGLSTMRDAIQPRVKSSAQALVPRAHMLRRLGRAF
jgi:hypothetical protein